MQLITLHRIDGGEVLLNPSQITSLHMAANQHNKVVPSAAHCVVGLTDGKYVFVTENCAEVRRKLEEGGR